MKKLINVLLYSLLLAVTLAGIGGIRYFIIQEQARAEKQAQRLVMSNTAVDDEPAENRGIVLVKKLPVYRQKKIVKAKTEADREVLSYKDEVTILQKDGLYTKIKTKTGTIGYVWGGCIGEPAALELLEEEPPCVIVIDAAVQDAEPAHQGLTGRELSLRVAEKLEKKLERRGYIVILAVREKEEALSDAKSAELSNGIKADAVIHICVGAGSSEDPAAGKAAVYCIAGDSEYPAAKQDADSKKLGEHVLSYYAEAVGFESAGIIEYDAYKRMQLSKRPVLLLKLGELDDAEQKAKMQKSKFQAKMAKGIADGVDAYFKEKRKKD